MVVFPKYLYREDICRINGKTERVRAREGERKKRKVSWYIHSNDITEKLVIVLSPPYTFFLCKPVHIWECTDRYGIRRWKKKRNIPFFYLSVFLQNDKLQRRTSPENANISSITKIRYFHLILTAVSWKDLFNDNLDDRYDKYLNTYALSPTWSKTKSTDKKKGKLETLHHVLSINICLWVD